MDYKKYYKEIDAQKQINKLAKKYKDKKIIIYGTGLMSDVLMENYDVSKLNIVAFADGKYQLNSDEKYHSYNTINPKELIGIDFDILLINVLRYKDIENTTKFGILIGSKNENKIVKRLLEPSLKFLIKNVLF